MTQPKARNPRARSKWTLSRHRSFAPLTARITTDLKDWGRTWWVPIDPQLGPVGPHERIAWLHSETDLLNCSALIDLVDPRTGRKWLALDGFSKWIGWAMRDGHREMQRDTWFRLRCFVVASAHEEQIVNSLKDRLHLDGRSLPYMEVPSQFYLGEFPWDPDIIGLISRMAPSPRFTPCPRVSRSWPPYEREIRLQPLR